MTPLCTERRSPTGTVLTVAGSVMFEGTGAAAEYVPHWLAEGTTKLAGTMTLGDNGEAGLSASAPPLLKGGMKASAPTLLKVGTGTVGDLAAAVGAEMLEGTGTSVKFVVRSIATTGGGAARASVAASPGRSAWAKVRLRGTGASGVRAARAYGLGGASGVPDPRREFGLGCRCTVGRGDSEERSRLALVAGNGRPVRASSESPRYEAF